jgi:hypothetical protein
MTGTSTNLRQGNLQLPTRFTNGVSYMDANRLQYVAHCANLASAWRVRRVASGKVPLTADEKWARINKKWPTLTEAEKEEVFNLAG